MCVKVKRLVCDFILGAGGSQMPNGDGRGRPTLTLHCLTAKAQRVMHPERPLTWELATSNCLAHQVQLVCFSPKEEHSCWIKGNVSMLLDKNVLGAYPLSRNYMCCTAPAPEKGRAESQSLRNFTCHMTRVLGETMRGWRDIIKRRQFSGTNFEVWKWVWWPVGFSSGCLQNTSHSLILNAFLNQERMRPLG